MRNQIGANPTLTPKRRLLRLAQTSLYWTGIASVYARRCHPSPATILMYHSVAASQHARWIAPRNRMTPQTFERHMRFLARHRRVISIDQYVDDLEEGRPARSGTVVLTFDDGYLDNLQVAAPILERYGLPAVIYLCTGYLNRTENQWADVLYSTFVARQRQQLSIDGLGVLDLRQTSGELTAYAAISQVLLSANYSERTNLLSDVTSQLQPRSATPRLTMTWNEARQLTKQYPKLTLGIHTADHLDLSSLGVNDALAEIEQSIDHYRKQLGRPPSHFSCPYSRSSPQAIGCLPQRGIRSAMTTVGVNDPHSTSPMDLYRLEAPGSQSLLRYWTCGAHPQLSTRLLGRS